MSRFSVAIMSLLLFLSILCGDCIGASGSVRVGGYTRKDGTYVAPHYRSAPDGNFNNNWSTKGNVNPYTGEVGTKTSPSSQGFGPVYVEGYFKADGTYVVPHYRSAPDGDPSNNLSTKANVNPYASDFQALEAERMKERKAYWKQRGHDVDSLTVTSSYALDTLLGEAERMKERKVYWKARGHDVDSMKVSSSYALDTLLSEAERMRERKAYWQSRGHDVDKLTGGNSYTLDTYFGEAERMKERKAYWKGRGWDADNLKVKTSYELDSLLSAAEKAGLKKN